jgi:ketosteroid isomerase-like protein
MLKLINKAPHFFILTFASAFVFATNAQTLQTASITETTNTRSNLQIVKDMYGSFAIGDVPAVVADMDQNVEWNESENLSYADGNPYIGPDAVVKGVFSRLGSEWDCWKLTDQVFYEAKNGEIIVTGRYDAKYKKTGKEINAQFVHIFWIENGKVIKFQQYADTYQVNSAMQ